MKMFKQYPLANYWFDNKEDAFLIRNIFLKVGLLEYLKDNPKVLTNYVLKADERADVLAYKIYGNSHLHWTIYLVNDILDPKDWVMNNYRFDDYLKEKYLNEDEIAFTTRKGEYAELETNRFMVEKNPFGTVDSDPDSNFLNPLTYDKITVIENETNINDGKRIVKAIRKEYINAFLSDFEKKIKSLDGK